MREVVKTIQKEQKFTEEQIAMRYPKSGEPIIKNRIAFAREMLRKAGYIKTGSPSGIWELTPSGERDELKEIKQKSVAATREEARKRARKQKRSKATKSRKLKSLQKSEEESGVQKTIETELLEQIQNISPRAFEFFCRKLLTHVGFEEVKVTKQSRDGGFDGEGLLVTNPFVKTRILFECKKIKGTVSVDIVRKLKGTGPSKGEDIRRAIITTGTFSKDAEDVAKEKEGNFVELIDGEALVELCKQHQIGVCERKAYDLDYEFFEKFKGDDK